jgi:hypothetical protein
MIYLLAHYLTMPIVAYWRNSSPHSWRSLPTPTDDPIAIAAGPSPERVLLVGSGLAVGFGVLTHTLSLGGHLARALSQQTSHGTSVEILARPDLRLHETVSLIDLLDAPRFDAIVMTFGGAEAAESMSPRRWGRDLDKFITEIRRAGLPELRVFVVAVPQLPSQVDVHVLARMMRRNVNVINEESRRVCARHAHTHFVAFDPTEGVDQPMGSATYAQWGRLIAAPIARALLRRGVRVSGPEELDETARQRAVDSLRHALEVSNERIEGLVRTARGLFGTTGAVLTAIDGDQLRVVASAGMRHSEISRAESMCALTIRTPELFVVEDTFDDARFRGMGWVTGSEPVRFYAACPIVARNGQRIGALCITDVAPRTLGRAESELLRELAHGIQNAIWDAAAGAQKIPG